MLMKGSPPPQQRGCSAREPGRTRFRKHPNPQLDPMITNTNVEMTLASSARRGPRATRQPWQCASSSKKSCIPQAFLALTACLCSAASALAETYTLTQINPPAGASSSSVESVNNGGQVVGNTSIKSGGSSVPGPAFVWTNGTAVTLPSFASDTAAEARAIGDAGVIVGQSPRANTYSQLPRAVWWQNTGAGYVVADWNAFLPAGSSLRLITAVAISTDSQFVVFDQVDSVTGHDQAVVAQVAFTGATPSEFSKLWLIDSLDGTVSSDGFVSAGTDISHNGNGIVRVVGYAQLQGTSGRAFLWEKDVVSEAVRMTDLDTVTTSFSSGEGVNIHGEVTGNIGSQAYYWNALGVKQQLPTLGGARSFAHSINDAGSIVGWSQRSGKNTTAHAFIWQVSSGIRDLNTLKTATDTSGIELTSAGKINNLGQILSRGVRKSVGVNVLLKPVP